MQKKHKNMERKTKMSNKKQQNRITKMTIEEQRKATKCSKRPN